MITLPYPPTTNNLYVNIGDRRVKSRGYRAWLSSAGWELKAQRPAPVKGRYILTIIADAPDKRARDIDNLIKPVSDLLKACGVIEDDHMAKSVMATWSDVPAAKGSTVRVRVEPYVITMEAAATSLQAIDRVRGAA